MGKVNDFGWERTTGWEWDRERADGGELTVEFEKDGETVTFVGVNYPAEMWIEGYPDISACKDTSGWNWSAREDLEIMFEDLVPRYHKRLEEEEEAMAEDPLDFERDESLFAEFDPKAGF